MKSSLKMHFNRYLFYYILLALLLIPLSILIVVFIRDFKLYLEDKNKLPDYTEEVKQLYEINPDLFQFDENDTFVLKMDYLLETRIADKIIRIVGRPHLSENFEQCVGYLIVKNINNNITVDNSHICDIIDY